MWFVFSQFLGNVTIEMKIYQHKLKEMSEKQTKKHWTNGIQL